MGTSETVTLSLANKQVSQPLPPLCVCCGKFTTLTKPWTFRWRPAWYNLLDFIPGSGGGMGYRECKMEAPVCEEHAHVMVVTKNMRRVTTALMLVVLAVSYLASTYSDRLPFLPDRFGLALVIAVVVFSLFVALAVYVYNRSHGIGVRAVRIEDWELTLAGVSSQFSDALKQPEGQRMTAWRPR